MPERGPFRDFRVLVTELALIPIATLADAERPASQRNADATAGDRFHGHLFTQGWP